MNILLITNAGQWLCFSIAAFFLMLGISAIVWAISTAECYEFEDDPIAPDNFEPVTYQEIIDCERPYISYQ